MCKAFSSSGIFSRLFNSCEHARQLEKPNWFTSIELIDERLLLDSVVLLDGEFSKLLVDCFDCFAVALGHSLALSSRFLSFQKDSLHFFLRQFKHRGSASVLCEYSVSIGVESCIFKVFNFERRLGVFVVVGQMLFKEHYFKIYT